MSWLLKGVGIILGLLIVWYVLFPILLGTMKTMLSILLMVVLIIGLVSYFIRDKLKSFFSGK